MTSRHVLAALLTAALLVACAGPATGAADGGAACAGARDFDADGQDDAVAGDPLAEVSGTWGAGAVRVVPVGSSATARSIVLTAPEPRAGDAFGWSVRAAYLDGDACMDIVVGAPYTTVDGEAGAGAVYVFYGRAGTRRAPVRLTAPSPERDAHFGWSLATGQILGRPDALVVGAPYQDADGVTDSGAVYVYQPTDLSRPRTVTQETENVIGNSEEGDLYGWSLALGLMGGRHTALDLAVGTPYENDDGAGRQKGGAGTENSGAVVLLLDVMTDDLSSVKWTLSEAARGVKDATGDRFGHALAYGGYGGKPYLAVSAPLADNGDAPDSGVIQLFRPASKGELAPAGTIRSGEGPLSSGSPAAGSALGWSLTLLTTATGLSLAAGSPFESRDGPESGAIHLIPLTGGGASSVLTAPDPRPYDHFGWSLATSGSPAPYAPGTVLLAGSPDQSSGQGALTLARAGGTAHMLYPGEGSPAADVAPADLGASVGG
ncbi:hypothetical protein ABGB17_24020 [Sphaerisporangium sp. B11E5]|uniref:FG-GAP repeat protein n=1 Tax=Sphaerisporangium sp. B11E5 TaxID=3153563 RepID=UPI00325D137C